MMLRFVVIGVPQQKGSMRAFVPKGWTRPILTSTNAKAKPWQQQVAHAAGEAIRQMPTFRPFEGAVRLQAIFYMPRPKSIKNRMPDHLKAPDIDKLLRSAIDALSKIVFRDDALIVEVAARKQYARPAEAPRAEICISEYSELTTRKAG
jgi:crossover junction endodeoxyribonuclease RusA